MELSEYVAPATTQETRRGLCLAARSASKHLNRVAARSNPPPRVDEDSETWASVLAKKGGCSFHVGCDLHSPQSHGIIHPALISVLNKSIKVSFVGVTPCSLLFRSGLDVIIDPARTSKQFSSPNTELGQSSSARGQRGECRAYS